MLLRWDPIRVSQHPTSGQRRPIWGFFPSMPFQLVKSILWHGGGSLFSFPLFHFISCHLQTLSSSSSTLWTGQWQSAWFDSIRLARSKVNSKQKKKKINQVSQLHSFSIWGICICIQLLNSSWRMHHEEPEPEGPRLTVHARAFRFHRLLPAEFCSCCRQHIGKSQKLKGKQQQQQQRCQSYYSRQHLVQNIQT